MELASGRRGRTLGRQDRLTIECVRGGRRTQQERVPGGSSHYWVSPAVLGQAVGELHNLLGPALAARFCGEPLDEVPSRPQH
jgi:hypothetical protein